ncbi:MAG: class I SAM-dependent methyltransferase [Novosphingobium sp.]|nr:class I SAM-dependent methyltransferase [Novosphingobium sp.]
MVSTSPPSIFSSKRRRAVRQRMMDLQFRPDAPRYLAQDYAEDGLERLAFLRKEPGKALVIGDVTGTLAAALERQGAQVSSVDPATGFDEEQPNSGSGYDLIASLGTLDTVNDLPGALIHIRAALAPGGLMIASFPGAGSLPVLRACMLAADGERPAPRLHPMVDVRAGGQLLQRTGFADPVIDSRPLDVSFRTLDSLVADLRAQGLSNVLADPGPPLGRAALERARAAFAEAGENGRTTERFELLTLSGWKR